MPLRAVLNYSIRFTAAMFPSLATVSHSLYSHTLSRTFLEISVYADNYPVRRSHKRRSNIDSRLSITTNPSSPLTETERKRAIQQRSTRVPLDEYPELYSFDLRSFSMDSKHPLGGEKQLVGLTIIVAEVLMAVYEHTNVMFLVIILLLGP